MHIPKEELSLYAAHPDGLSSARQSEIDAHLHECSECQQAHDLLLVREDDLVRSLKERDTWEIDPSVGSATLQSLKDIGRKIAEEDRQAEILLKDFLNDPMNAAWTRLSSRRYHTGGVVRKLNAIAHQSFENAPLVALTFAEAAISVAEVLPKDLYPANGVYRLRGNAWKEAANAQLYLGQFPQAHDALDRAEAAYQQTSHNGLGLAMTALIRAGVFYEQGDLDAANAMAARAEAGFAHVCDEKRRMDAVFLRGGIAYEAGQLRFAIQLFQQLIEYGENQQDTVAIARGSYAIGNCEIDLGNLAEASLQFHKAFSIFRATGPIRERIQTEWGIARVVLHSGKHHEAIRRLRDVAAAFERLGMLTNAALVGLDIADALLGLRQSREIVPLARHLFGVFRNAGMLTGALSATAYLKEAAAAGNLTPSVLKEIRSFLRRVERQPHLQFVPPPPPTTKTE